MAPLGPAAVLDSAASMHASATVQCFCIWVEIASSELHCCRLSTALNERGEIFIVLNQLAEEHAEALTPPSRGPSERARSVRPVRGSSSKKKKRYFTITACSPSCRYCGRHLFILYKLA